MKRYFCTYFDHHYLARGLAMYRSLREHCDLGSLWVLCLSDVCYEALIRLALPNVMPLKLSEFEAGDASLLAAKRNRTMVEYYFTCTPSLPLYVFAHAPQIDVITYLDSDLYFFGDVEVLFGEIGEGSIAMIGHRFSQDDVSLEMYGRFNVGWVTFRPNQEGLSALGWWRRRCLEWCHDYVENGKFADQKYLDDFPSLFPNVVVIQHRGANVAPWNVGNVKLHLKAGKLHIDGNPLLFFHFHGIRRIAPGVIDPNLAPYGIRVSALMESQIFRPYFQSLRVAKRQVTTATMKVDAVGGRRRTEERGIGILLFLRAMWRLISAYGGLITRRCLLAKL